MKQINFLVVAILGLAVMITACRRDDEFVTDTSAMLEFSVDTLMFDTVFTELGSATRWFKVYNTYDQPINISNISMASGADSKFRLNVDGTPTSDIDNIKIQPQDSIYIFSEVTIDPDEPTSLSPFVINDEVIFETNGNTQAVTLEAWGQNAIYLPSRFGAGGIATLACDFADVTWTNELPYVIYGILVIDECTLNVEPGARIYVHGGIARTFDAEDNPLIYNDGLIVVQPNGHLNMQGTREEPIIVQGDRLEEGFAEAPGQWVGIRIGSVGNIWEHVEVKNSLVGAYVDSSAFLTIRDSRVYNTAGPGIVGIHSRILGENVLLYNNGSNSLQLGYGGKYDFRYSTIASYGVDAPALSMSNGICLDPFCSQFRVNNLSADFKNCIIFGSRGDEISLSDFENGAELDYNFENCIVRVDDLVDPMEEFSFPDFFDHCNPCTNATTADAIFFDPNEDDFHLDTLSIAEQGAQPLPQFNLLLDLDGNERDVTTPDIGCFEYQY